MANPFLDPPVPHVHDDAPGLPLDDAALQVLCSADAIDDKLISHYEQLVASLRVKSAQSILPIIHQVVKSAVENHRHKRPLVGLCFFVYVLLSMHQSQIAAGTARLDVSALCPLVPIVISRIVQLSASSEASGSLSDQSIVQELFLQLQLLYLVCQVGPLTIAEISCFDLDVLHHLFRLLEQTTAPAMDHLNDAATKAILTINDQSLCHAAIPNIVSIALVSAPARRTFAENVIFMLNRSTDPYLNLMILKLVYNTLSRPLSGAATVRSDLFYVNDLRVLLDIVLRELSSCDEATTLSYALLRVLQVVLQNEMIKDEKYKHAEVARLCDGFYGAQAQHVSDETRRLAERVRQELV
ncbi:pre-rRNA processing [Sorochytrium milnesiophthora]